MLTELGNSLDQGIAGFCKLSESLWGDYSFFSMPFNVSGMLAIILVAVVCGAIGSLVVGNRMAFFSDALAHCAFAGVAVGLLLALILKVRVTEFTDWIILIMVIFGIFVGLGIAWVREQTALSSDTVIGVFFAGAIGFGAMLMKAVAGRGFNLEQFLFGDPLTARGRDLILFLILLVGTGLFLFWMYNSLVFASFNASLARSRQVRVRLCNYLLIALLGIIINVCIHIVGTLLINGLLIVPAATAGNLSRNMRQLFWWSIGLCLFAGVGGQVLSWEIRIPDPAAREPIHFGISGTIVVLSVIVFFISMALGPMWRNRLRPAPPLRSEASVLQ